jgi:hypothetical protein
VKPGTRIHLHERLTGLLLVPDGARCVYTLERGKVAIVTQLVEKLDQVEVESNGLKLMFRRESLLRAADLVTAA